MRILHFAYWFGNATVDLVNAQAARHDLMYITTRKALEWTAGDEWPQIYDSRIRLRPERERRRRDPLYYVDRTAGMWKGFCRFRPDVTHIQWPSDHFSNHLFLQLKDMPIVFTVHDPVPHLGEEMRGFDERQKLILDLERRADMIIVHGEGVKKQLLQVNPELDPERIAVVLLVPQKYLLRWRLPEYRERPGTVLFFGRINEYKGLGVLMDAWERIREECPDARLVVAGTGNDLPNYRERILKDDRCELIDRFIDNPEVARLYAESSVVVMPYVEGTASGQLAVALAFGKPVVVTDVGALPEMVEDGRSGLIVPPKDPEALASAVCRLLKDDQLRESMAARTRELSETILSPDSLALKTEEVYRKAIERRMAK